MTHLLGRSHSNRSPRTQPQFRPVFWQTPSLRKVREVNPECVDWADSNHRVSITVPFKHLYRPSCVWRRLGLVRWAARCEGDGSRHGAGFFERDVAVECGIRSIGSLNPAVPKSWHSKFPFLSNDF